MAAERRSLGVLTSGGDAPGMNAAVRSVVRSALDVGVEVFAIYEGYRGLVEGGDLIRPAVWDSVGGILHQGGTIIGTARCDEFREREGRRQAARNLVERNIDSLVVIGGDGSLIGANTLRREWSELLAELVERGDVPEEAAERHHRLTVIGLVGSIDNDMQGTDMTIGAMTALHRITEAIDALSSTAASHQRSFVVEVMGRHCGFLAVMAGLAGGVDWVLIPESPPEVDDWESLMCDQLKAGREAGRRDSIVVVAEGAIDRKGRAIETDYVRRVIAERLGEEVRVTILGHVQRGGSPCAYDRNLGSVVGHAAVQELLDPEVRGEARLIGIQENRVTRRPLVECVEETRRVEHALEARDFGQMLALRGRLFNEAYETMRTLVRTLPRPSVPGRKRLRLAIMNAGAPAPGMNSAVRAAVRLGLDKGHDILGVKQGIDGLIEGQIDELDWMSVNGFASRGGSELGCNRKRPVGRDFYAIAKNLEGHGVDGLLVIGGWTAYQTAYEIVQHREGFPAFDIPIVCMPASITNNLPGAEMYLCSDTALNSIIRAVDAIKQSAVASQRCFIVEVMGYYCGYLALLSGLATGAERVYLHEEGVTLKDLQDDVEHLIAGFEYGKRLGLIIRNEMANPVYDTAFMEALFEEEGGDLFEVRKAILGHMQQGGDPSPFDRISAARLATRCIEYLDEQGRAGEHGSAFIGARRGQVEVQASTKRAGWSDERFQRPRRQWWMSLRPIARVLAQPAPSVVP